jgi:tripartite-type tricarboxylate transporter receptor subunit TctC
MCPASGDAILSPNPTRRQLLLAAAAGSLPLASQGQQAWPSKPIRILTPFTAGGATDIIARSLATHLQAALKQPVNVEPKPGADGALAAQELLRSPADGHTVYLATASETEKLSLPGRT